MLVTLEPFLERASEFGGVLVLGEGHRHQDIMDSYLLITIGVEDCRPLLADVVNNLALFAHQAFL